MNDFEDRYEQAQQEQDDLYPKSGALFSIILGVVAGIIVIAVCAVSLMGRR